MTSRLTVLSVVLSIAVLTAIALGGTIFLAAEVLNAAGPIDAASLGLVTGLSTLAGTGLGALGTLLASTRSTLGPNDTEPTTFQATVVRTTEPAAGPAGQV